MKLLAALLFLMGITAHSFAQGGLKIGHVNIPEVIQQMPEKDSIESVIEKEAGEMQAMYDEMIKEQQASIKKYESEKSGLSEFIREARETELLELSDKIQQFQQNAPIQLQKRSSDLYQPVYNKVNAAIKSVATREGFTYVLDVSNGVVAYKSPDSFDLNPLVLNELGL